MMLRDSADLPGQQQQTLDNPLHPVQVVLVGQRPIVPKLLAQHLIIKGANFDLKK
ncbi:hypothetical protein [Paenibacillus sp. V4I7]|uniref:hypothetical protein n=1 Tax=Paenibacillus sp. V4I7 TaxID=3042307 RepID=UPI00277D851C|nr:hypothetical protein [Paenibacillus sp. V4I7]MDQ0902329.1 hypothetical protein [Paenibacillus sp. V4I7]